MDIAELKETDRIFFSCYFENEREANQFIPVHVLGHVIAGILQVQCAGRTQLFKAGDTVIFKANQLGRLLKIPPTGGGSFKSINLIFDPQLTQAFSMEYGAKAEAPYTGQTVRVLPPSVLLNNFFDTLSPYFDPANKLTGALTTLKVKEALLLLLQTDSGLKNMLFDFKQPGKINLEEFMEQNYMFNVPIERFAQLTGRSLAAFKRDFNAIFKMPPGKWLQQRRLLEAHYLIKDKGKKSSDIYLDIGFEDLSHFSFAFKKAFGAAPSLL